MTTASSMTARTAQECARLKEGRDRHRSRCAAQTAVQAVQRSIVAGSKKRARTTTTTVRVAVTVTAGEPPVTLYVMVYVPAVQKPGPPIRADLAAVPGSSNTAELSCARKDAAVGRSRFANPISDASVLACVCNLCMQASPLHASKHAPGVAMSMPQYRSPTRLYGWGVCSTTCGTVCIVHGVTASAS